MRSADLTLEVLRGQPWLHASFTLEQSALLRSSVDEDRFDLWDFFNGGADAEWKDQKNEVESLIARLISTLDADTVALVWDERREWIETMRGRLAIEAAEHMRMVAFWLVQVALGQAYERLREDSFAPPFPSDRCFTGAPGLFGSLFDGMLPVTEHTVPDTWLGAENVFRWGESALFPHPHLAPMRELVAALTELGRAGEAQVYVAIDPLRRLPLAEVQPRLIEDQWIGIKLTPEILDSLDAKDIADSFHAPVDRHPLLERAWPLLGTWFGWSRRGDKVAFDPVRRVYIREVPPPLPTPLPGDLIMGRALHSERNTVKRAFTHVDGKMCAFAASNYRPSRNAPTEDPGPPARSRKLWRVDGDLPDETWGELVGLFFRHNELVAEHFADAVAASWPAASA